MRKLPFVLMSLVALGCGEKRKTTFSCPAPATTQYDADGDLLRDAWEAMLGTDPQSADSDGDLSGDYAEISAGTDPLDGASTPPATQLAFVEQITDASQLIGGPAAQGRIGDWLLRNDKIRAIVQAPGADQMAINGLGGNLIDADVVRLPGDPGIDVLGGIAPMFTLHATARPDRAVVISDGSDGGPAILRTCGREDQWEYLDLGVALSSFGLGFGIDTGKDWSWKVSNDFILAPGSSTVEIVTTIGNEGPSTYVSFGDVIDTGSATDIFSTNNRGFGEMEITDLLQEQPTVKFFAFESQSPRGTWGLLTDADLNTGLTLFGVSAILQGASQPMEVLGTTPEEGPAPVLTSLPRGKRASYHRAVVVSAGSGVEPVAAEWHRRHQTASVVRTGNVRDANGPIAGARVAILDSSSDALADRVPRSLAVTDSAGNYSVRLPDGAFWVVAEVPGRGAPAYTGGTPGTVTTRAEQHALAGTLVTLTTGTQLPDVDYPLGARLDVTVTDAAGGAPVPARIAVVGPDTTPDDSIFHNRKDKVPSVFAFAGVSGDGAFSIPVEPGTYDVTASRGFEWSLDSAQVTLAAGGTATQALSIGRVVDTTGWVSADFHVHMVNSPDSAVSLERRVVGAAADGLDVIVTTDHDYVTDLGPTIDSLALGPYVSSLPGDEISTTAFGHFIAFPLDVDGASVNGGAYRWAGPAGGRVNKTPREMFEEIDAANAGSQVKVVAHPRGASVTSYYDQVQVDTLTLQSKADPLDLNLPVQADATVDDSKLFYAAFDAQEIVNGSSGMLRGAAGDLAYRHRLMNDLFTLLSHGLTPVGLGNSDTHTLVGDAIALPRNYVKVSDDTPAAIPALREELATAVIGGKVTVNGGVFILASAIGDTSGGPGDLVVPSNGTLTLTVSLSMPDWVQVDTVKVFVNTPDTIAPFDSDNSVEPVAQYVNDTFTLTAQAAGNGLFRNVATVPFTITAPQGKDAWIVVTAEGVKPATKSLWPVVPIGSNDAGGLRAFAMSNAIFVDGNGTGAYEAPGPEVTAAFRRPAPREKREPRPGDLKLPLAPDVRAQFEKITDPHLH